jgi:hypothetical protein
MGSRGCSARRLSELRLLCTHLTRAAVGHAGFRRRRSRPPTGAPCSDHGNPRGITGADGSAVGLLHPPAGRRGAETTITAFGARLVSRRAERPSARPRRRGRALGPRGRGRSRCLHVHGEFGDETALPRLDAHSWTANTQNRLVADVAAFLPLPHEHHGCAQSAGEEP